jgi:alpha-ketoglutarate-dependent taurine dioxygenase
MTHLIQANATPLQMSKSAPPADKWAAIRDRGAVIISKAACSREEFEELTEELACEFFVHHNPSRRRLNADGTTQSVAVGHERLALHSERSYLPGKPELLFFYCVRSAAAGGETTLCDGAALCERMSADLRTSLKAARAIWSRILPVELLQRDPGFADLRIEAECARQASGARNGTFRSRVWTVRDSLHIEFEHSCVEHGWIANRDVFANYLLFKPDTPVVCERELPANWLEEVSSLADDLTVDIRWSAGDVAIVDNTRWLHGRRAFPADSDRLILVRTGHVVPGFRDRHAPLHFTGPARPR